MQKLKHNAENGYIGFSDRKLWRVQKPYQTLVRQERGFSDRKLWRVQKPQIVLKLSIFAFLSKR